MRSFFNANIYSAVSPMKAPAPAKRKPTAGDEPVGEKKAKKAVPGKNPKKTAGADTTTGM